MANQVSNVGFNDYSGEQADIERRRQLAQGLSQQSMQPLETQTAGGWAIPISPFQGLGKMLQSYAGVKGQQKATEQEKTLGQKYQTDLAAALMKSQSELAGRPTQTINPDPQEAQQSADYGTPQVGAVNKPAIAPYSQEAMGNAAQALMAHPATQPMGMSMTQQQMQMARMLQATGADGQPTQTAATPAPQAQGQMGPQPTQVASMAQVPPTQGPMPQQPPQGQVPQSSQAAGFDKNGVPIDYSRNLLNLDPTGAKYIDYVNQLHKPQISANGQVMQYQRQPDGSWGFGPGPGAIGAAKQFADVGELAKAANTPATVKFNKNEYDTTLDIANAIRSGEAPNEAIAKKAMQWAARNGIPARIGIAEGGAFTPVNERNLTTGSDGGATPQGRFGAPTAAQQEYAKADAGNAATYKNVLNDRVAQGSDLNMRLAESVDALKKFRAGGGAETRAQIAQLAQAIPGISPDVVNKIAGGDLAAMQEFQKLAVQQAMEQLKQAMGGAGRIAQAEFKVFQTNNPNLSTDPEAIKKIFDFNTKLYNRDIQEQAALAKYEESGQDPAGFRAHWTNELSRRGFTNPKLQAQEQPNAVKEIVNSGSPKPVRRYNPATGRIE